MKCPKCQKDMEIWHEVVCCENQGCGQDALVTEDLVKMIDELNDKIDSLNEDVSYYGENSPAG